ncbi:MAG: FHA domain-containing protein [Acidobacteria bacterium]|nr:FHA domain-containing protein [Acidobacteriota bacterium]
MARFLITDPSKQTQIFEISNPTVNIGRAESNDLVLNHPSISRHHARVNILPGGTTLIHDLGSLNGVFVNGQPIREHRLTDRDRINLGMYEMKYEVAAPQPVHVEAGSDTAGNLKGLVSPKNLTTALRARVEPVPAPAETIQDRVHTLEQENNLLKLLLAVGNTLSSVLTPDEIMHQVMELVFQMENVERGFVMLYDEKGGFKPAVLLYKDEKLKKDPRGVVLSKTLIERVTTERLPLLIYDVAGDERFSSSESLRLSGIRSAMCAPLIYKDKVFGLFYVDCLTKPYAFSKEELSIFSVISAEAAISFDNARSHDELSRRVIERKALERFLSSVIVEKILANPDEIHLGGENQTATILFADIRNFTRMSEKMAPQNVVELLNEYFTEMTDLIFDNGGTLDKYLGDGIMAVFGAPIARPDDAARSVKTAVEMQHALAQLNLDWGERGQPPMNAGIGVNTGPVTAGNIGSSRRMDYTVIGDAVNIASRLCANAAGSQILVSESTFQLLGGSLPARKLQPILVKGRETPVEVYEILWGETLQSPSGVEAAS